MEFPICLRGIDIAVCSHSQVFLIKFLWEERSSIKPVSALLADTHTLEWSSWASTRAFFKKMKLAETDKSF